MMPLSTRLPLFVYGTLRSGQPNYPVYLAHAVERIYRAWAHDQAMFAMDVPIVIDGHGAVTGELMFIRTAEYDRAIGAVDRLEGCDPSRSGIYERVARPIRYAYRDDEERNCLAWIYQATPMTLERFRTAHHIVSGDWVEWLSSFD